MSVLNLVATCPYDETHRIRKSILPYHLIRCRRNHSSKKVQCPFDACHIIEEAYFKDHILNCASSGNIRKDQYSFESLRQLGSVSLETVKNLYVPTMKDWKEENVPTYDPWKNTENRNIIRCLIGRTKSEKKMFKLTERQRLLNIEKRDITNANLRKNFKREIPKKHICDRNISYLVNKLKKLNLESIDVLLKSIDISKLFISEAAKRSIIIKEKDISEVIEKILVEKFKGLIFYHLEK